MKLKHLLWTVAVILLIGLIGLMYYLTWTPSEKPEDNDLCRRITPGLVRGEKRVSIIDNKTYYSFKGIPYAKPPIGPLRFKDPQPVEPWFDNVFNATKEGSKCLQGSGGSEDCLFINVYNSHFSKETKELQPVMVCIHGVGFVMGDGDEMRRGPDFLVERDVVLVTFNYRLGVFGFLSLENDDIPGNAGLKDQVLALKWVQDNIEAFGGNPENVTLFGQSAGSASIQFHILSAMSSGMFQGAIMESGAAISEWVIQTEPVRRAFILGELIGANTTNSESLTESLRSVNATILFIAQWGVRTERFYGGCMSLPFTPSIEKKTSGNNFILEHPRKTLSLGNFTKVPMMIGIVDSEGTVLLSSVRKFPELVSSFSRFLPADLKLKNDSQEFKELTKAIRNMYFHDKPINVEESLAEFSEICGDLCFVNGVHQTINYFLNQTTLPIYVFQFSFDGKFGYTKKDINDLWNGTNSTLPKGTYHGDELSYLFNKHRETSYDRNSKDFRMIMFMTDSWTNFAKYHNPNFINKAEWPATEIGRPKYLHIGNPISLEETQLAPSRTKVWDTIYEKFG